MLDRIHGAGVDVDVGIEFLHGDVIAARLQQTAKRCCGDAFAKTGHDATGDKYVFHWHKNGTSLRFFGDVSFNKNDIIQLIISEIHIFMKKLSIIKCKICLKMAWNENLFIRIL